MDETNVMTDEQLIEEYSKEVWGDLYTPERKFTVEMLIDQSRKFREITGELSELRRKAIHEGYDRGIKMAEDHKVTIETLRNMTIQQLANLIGTDD
jgi:hypothetical protein